MPFNIADNKEETLPNNCHAGHSRAHVAQSFRGREKLPSHKWFIRNLFARHRLPPAIICDDSQKPECRSWHLFARHCFRERMKMRWRRLRETSGERLNRGPCKTNIYAKGNVPRRSRKHVFCKCNTSTL